MRVEANRRVDQGMLIYFPNSPLKSRRFHVLNRSYDSLRAVSDNSPSLFPGLC